MNTLFTSQFNYCVLTWMFHSRRLNNTIKRLHERCLRLIYSDRISLYEELLDRSNFVQVLQNNLQKLATEMFKIYTWIAPQIIGEVFPRNCALNYNLRRHPEFASRAINAVHYGLESISFLVPKIWEMLPREKLWFTRSSQIKNKKLATTKKCPCRLWKRYIHQVGFTQISKWFWFLSLWDLIPQSGQTHSSNWFAIANE